MAPWSTRAGGTEEDITRVCVCVGGGLNLTLIFAGALKIQAWQKSREVGWVVDVTEG